MSVKNPIVLIVVIGLVAGAIYLINSQGVKFGDSPAVELNPGRITQKAERLELGKEITTPDGFINTGGRPINISDLVGEKVILVDFWTYSCINCQRTTPYLNSWHEKYSDKGLVILGIHTPEFEFEKNYDNVSRAVEKFEIKYPVVLDNDYSTWTAYKNRYWPRKYLIDIDGYIIYDHIGEGAYEETEMKIQEALRERMAVLGEVGEIAEKITEEIKNGATQRSPEIYFGALRNDLLGNGVKGKAGRQVNLLSPREPLSDILYLTGDWNIESEYAENLSPGSVITFKYVAKDVFFVAEADREIVVEVRVDGKFLKTINVKDAGLYEIMTGSKSESRMLELIIKEPGLKAYTFTFG